MNNPVCDVYKGRNSPSNIIVSDEDGPVDFLLGSVTKVGVVVDGVEYSSDEGYITFGDNGEVEIRLGLIPNPPTGVVIARLIIYTEKYPNGKPIITERSKNKLIFEFL